MEREAKWQRAWADARLFEAVPDGREKFFCTFPYPYVNGLPHIGHLFTIMRVEAFARYHRLRGRNVLFPQGFHATGSPITTAALRVKEGDPKQIKILKDLGVPDDEIPSFAEPEHWIAYFVPKYSEDLTRAGLSVDWRRTFHTTSLNPQYDAFIRWQFLKLKERGYIQQGEHPVVWCPKEQCPVSDHARSVGEGETPQEFLIVKHKLPDGRFLVSATLRPDTILGVTNVYVHPKAQYAELAVQGETWIASRECAAALAEQGRINEVTGEVDGASLVGLDVEEFAGARVPVLPATFVDPKAGTGIVHSVPSESADDLIALRDLQQDEKTMHAFKLDTRRIKAIEPIMILKMDGVEGIPAQFFLDKYGVRSQKEKGKLEEIRKELYKASFYGARFGELYATYGLAGVPVQEGKDEIKRVIVDAGWGVPYWQLTGRVVCRCQTESVVRIVDDQWFITYSDKGWKEATHDALNQLALYPEKARPQFEYVLDWLQDWACTREFGLGTRLPWDERWLIESLSDSTAYMAYYTIAHLVKGVPVGKLTPTFFDWVFLGVGEMPDVEGVQAMRDEFSYWYPLDFRNSGKDLVQNHLAFMLFNHCALFPKEHWPRGIGVNGWVTVNGQKMSKSLGNVIPVRTLLDEYGADATRITILNGGEGMDDPNWDSDFARGMVGKLDALIRNATTDCAGETSADAWLRSRMHALIREITAAMDRTDFRTAIQLAFFEWNQMLAWYAKRAMGAPGAVYREALAAQLVMLSPFVPHACEEAWHAMGNEGFVSVAPWPAYDESAIDPALDVAESLVRDTLDALRKREGDVTLYLAAQWKRDAYAAFDAAVEMTRNPNELIRELSVGALKTHGEELSRLVKFLVKGRTPGPIPTAAQEREWLSSAKEFLEKESGCSIAIEDAGSEGKAAQGLPGRPAVVLRE